MSSRPTLLRRRRSVAHVWGCATAVTVLAAAAPLGAQYPLAPSPVLDMSRLSNDIRISGYLSVREALRNDSSTFSVNRARVTVQTAPVPFLAVRLQGDLSAIGRIGSDSSVPGFSLTDAYAQLVPPQRGGALAALKPAFIVGQFKTPFSLEYNTSFSLMRTANRSLIVDRHSPRRDLGVLAQVSVSRWARLMGAVVNGGGANVTRNVDGRELVLGRLTLLPLPDLAISGKLSNEGGDHRWGYDARWIVADRLVVEGEWLRRTRPVGTTIDARGGYGLAAFKVLPWLEPVVKWERLTEGTTVEARTTWTTVGVNLLSRGEALRVQVNWINRSERPIELDDDELNVQVIGIY